MHRLESQLKKIDGRGYPAYKNLKGVYSFADFDLDIVHVQGDPFAAPSRIEVRIEVIALPVSQEDISNPNRRIGLEDGILRSWISVLSKMPRRQGSGKSGLWIISQPGQEMLPRTSCEIDSEFLTLRFCVGLPAQGRRVLGRTATCMLLDDLPNAMLNFLENDGKLWHQHALSYEDQQSLRAQLSQKQWAGFIGNDSLLPRTSGIDDKPLEPKRSTLWKSPKELQQSVTLPNAGEVTGTAIAEGVTLICGGGYHGKSTLLQALSRGVYNHIPGDGRELCVSKYESVFIRSEDGRAIKDVDISPFISDLPNKKDTKQFSTENASGSTSQAANIVEALELGAKTLFLDEDTSATNFMIRDSLMRKLVPDDKEPIRPFISHARNLAEQMGVSLVLVIGGSGEYLSVADTVLVMENYVPRLATKEAKKIAPASKAKDNARAFTLNGHREVRLGGLIDPRKRTKIRTDATRFLRFGAHEIDLSLIGQLVDGGQTKTLGDWLFQLADEPKDLPLLEQLEAFETSILNGEEPLSKRLLRQDGECAFCRRFELGAAINRIRFQTNDDKGSQTDVN